MAVGSGKRQVIADAGGPTEADADQFTGHGREAGGFSIDRQNILPFDPGKELVELLRRIDQAILSLRFINNGHLGVASRRLAQ